jgi:hypothetical protein
MTGAPAVTVLMPVHNGGRFVAEAIESILQQTFTDFEFVIVDDGSTDDTPSIVASFTDSRIRILRSEALLGLPRALNRGLAAAKGQLVARQDSDDRSHPRRLAAEVAFLRANPEVALVGTQVRVIDKRGRISRPPAWWRATTASGIRFQSLFDNPFLHSSVLFRRDRVGGYDESFATAEDFELWSRVAAEHPVRNLPEALVDLRMHAGSMGAAFAGEHIARSSAVIARNLRAALGDVPDGWCRLLAELHVDPRVRRGIDGRDVLGVLWSIYERVGADDAEVRGIMARKLADVACSLASTQRRSAIAAFARACRCDLRTASSFATRFLGRLALP